MSKKISVPIQLVEKEEDIPINLTDDDDIYMTIDNYNVLVKMAKKEGVTPDQMFENIIKFASERDKKNGNTKKNKDN